MGNLGRSITFLHPWVGDSLTPYWIFCLGVAAGLGVLLVLWGIAALISRIPAVGTLAEKTGPRTIASFLAALAIFAVCAPFFWTAMSTTDVAGAQAADRFESIGLGYGLLVVASILGGFAVVMLVSRRAVDEVPLAVKEGVLWPVFVVCMGLAAFGVVGITTVKEPFAMLASFSRLPAMGVTQRAYSISEATVGDDEEIP